jgi:hypothetical protein
MTAYLRALEAMHKWDLHRLGPDWVGGVRNKLVHHTFHCNMRSRLIAKRRGHVTGVIVNGCFDMTECGPIAHNPGASYPGGQVSL